MRTALTEKFGIEYPIFAFSHCRDVAAAVSRAGGMGVLGAAEFTPEQFELELRWMDEHVDGKPYGVDVVMPTTHLDLGTSDPAEMSARIASELPEGHKQYVVQLMDELKLPPLPEGEQPLGVLGWTYERARQHVDVALAHPVKLLVNALGSPPPDVIDLAHSRGVAVGALAGKAEHGRRHADSGLDLVVAVGSESGGHTGEISTMVLVPEMVDAVSPLPVLAAGGIGTGRQIAAALALGAQGVWMGSIWLTTAESNSVVIDRLLAAKSSDPVRTRAFSGKPARMLPSAWTRAWDDPTTPKALPMPLHGVLCAEAFTRIERTATSELKMAAVGQIVGRMNEIRPVRTVMFDLVDEYIDTMQRTLVQCGLGPE